MNQPVKARPRAKPASSTTTSASVANGDNGGAPVVEGEEVTPTPVSSADQTRQAPRPDGAPDESLAPAAEVIFTKATNKFTLRDGTEVLVGGCKTRHIGLLLKLFNTLLTRMDQGQMMALVRLIADRQKAAMAAGRGPETVHVDELTEDKVSELVSKAYGNSSLMLVALQCVNDIMPEVAESLTNLSQEQYGDLDLDEGMKVIASIVMMNYDFFFQNMRPIVIGFLQQVAARLAKK